MKFKRTLLFLGILVVIHFSLTGMLMKNNFFLIESEHTLVRMMLRANHIYILFSGLILMLVSYSLKENMEVSYLSVLSYGILVIAAVGINICFYIEPISHLGLSTHAFQRKLTGFSIIGLLTGAGLHLLLIQFGDRKWRRNQH